MANLKDKIVQALELVETIKFLDNLLTPHEPGITPKVFNNYVRYNCRFNVGGALPAASDAATFLDDFLPTMSVEILERARNQAQDQLKILLVDIRGNLVAFDALLKGIEE